MPKVRTGDLAPISVEAVKQFGASDADRAFGYAVIGLSTAAIIYGGVSLITDSGDQSTGVSVNQLTTINTHGCPQGKPVASYQAHIEGIRHYGHAQASAN